MDEENPVNIPRKEKPARKPRIRSHVVPQDDPRRRKKYKRKGV